jgi:hypothetical protein
MTCSRATNKVFDSDFLEWLSHRDRGGPTFTEAEYAGPWTVRRREDGFAVVRESEGEDGVPDAELSERETALLLAAVLPSLGREQRFQLAAREGACGVDVKTVDGDGRLEKIGWLRYQHPELMEALSVLEWLLRSPASMAMFLEAASYEVLVHAGQILERRLHAGDGESQHEQA